MYEEWEELEKSIIGCEKCKLCKGRKNIVFGVGNKNADLMFIGEGPGADEDTQGEPFVGKAGKLMDKAFARTWNKKRRCIHSKCGKMQTTTKQRSRAR